ncbi:MAG: hypothetical protein OES32_00890 [Acidobacteriota bacterium]|nr:hypothetical protein [Acidobacteriota bacterium]
MRKHTLIAAIIVLALAPWLAAQTAPEPLSLDVALAHYLAEDCGSGEPDPRGRLTAVLRFGDAAVEPLLRIVAAGPDTEILEAAERDARDDFAASRRFLADGGLEGLDDDLVRELAESMSEDSYVDQRVRGVDSAYRQRALNALVELGSTGTGERLAAVAEQTEDAALREWIEEAIGRLPG